MSAKQWFPEARKLLPFRSLRFHILSSFLTRHLNAQKLFPFSSFQFRKHAATSCGAYGSPLSHVSVGLKVFRSLHWFTEASLLIILEMLFLFSSCLLRKLPPTSCDSYGSLIPHDLEILVVDDLILSNLMFKTYHGSVRPQLLSFNLRSKVCRYWLPLFQWSFTARGLWSGSSPEPSPESVIRLSSVLHIAWVLSVWNRWFSSITHFSLFRGKCLHFLFH